MPATLEETAIDRAVVKPHSPKVIGEKLRAPFSLRCGAILIDYIVLTGVVAFSTLIARLLGGGARTAGTSSETIGIVVSVLIAVLDLVVLPGLTGLTVGKWAAGLRIERPNGAKPGIGRALLRHFLGYPLSLLTLGIGFIMGIFGGRGRTLHDLIAGTVVVRDSVNIPQTRR